MEIINRILLEPFFVILISGTLTASTPILLAAIGEDFVESGGMLNLGLEGMMLLGAFTAFVVALKTQSIYWGMISGILAGLISALFFGYLVIYLKINQIVIGLGLTLFSIGITSLLYRTLFGNTFPVISKTIQKVYIPLLSEIPYLRSLFNLHIITYISVALLPSAWWLLYKTNFGLSVRAVGEDPNAADAHGVNVFLTRFNTVLIEGMLSGLAGAFLSIYDLNFFINNMTQGRGFIAIAIVMLSKWNPYRILYGSLLFGVCNSLTYGLQILGLNAPREFILMLPYVFIIILLCFLARNTRLPGAFCKPYERE